MFGHALLLREIYYTFLDSYRILDIGYLAYFVGTYYLRFFFREHVLDASCYYVDLDSFRLHMILHQVTN